MLCVLAAIAPVTTHAASYSLTLEVPTETIENFISQITNYLMTFSLQDVFYAARGNFEIRCEECRAKVDAKIEDAQIRYNTKVDEIKSNVETRKQAIQERMNSLK